MKHGAHLFVYGTLMRGLENHGILRRLGARFVAEGSVAGRLYLCTYPALVLDEDGPRVHGEAYLLPPSGKLLAVLDAFEDEGTMYRRTLVTVHLAGQRPLEAYAYRYLLPVEGCLFLEHGRFRRYRLPQRHETASSHNPKRCAASRH